MNDDFRQTYLLHVMAATHFSVRRFKRLPAASNTLDSKKIIAIIVVQSAAEKKCPIVFRSSFIYYFFFVNIIIAYIRHMGKKSTGNFFSPIDFFYIYIYIQLLTSIHDIIGATLEALCSVNIGFSLLIVNCYYIIMPSLVATTTCLGKTINY